MIHKIHNERFLAAGNTLQRAEDAQDIVLRWGHAVGLENAAEEEIELPGHHKDVHVELLGVVFKTGLCQVVFYPHVANVCNYIKCWSIKCEGVQSCVSPRCEDATNGGGDEGVSRGADGRGH